MESGNVAAAAAVVAVAVSTTSESPLPQPSPSQPEPAAKAPALPASKPSTPAISMTAALKNVGAVSIHLLKSFMSYIMYLLVCIDWCYQFCILCLSDYSTKRKIA